MMLTSATVDIQSVDAANKPGHVFDVEADEHSIRKQACEYGLHVTACAYTNWNGVFEVTVCGDEPNVQRYLQDIGWGIDNGYAWGDAGRGIHNGHHLYPLTCRDDV